MPAPALPPRPAPPAEDRSNDLFRTLAALIEGAGARIAYGDIPGEASWNNTTHTLTLRAGAGDEDRTYALSEFCRRIHLGHDYSHFIPTPTRRHLHAVP